jgi:hypothetical protein
VGKKSLDVVVLIPYLKPLVYNLLSDTPITVPKF